jgi:signal transduction histidine kinase
MGDPDALGQALTNLLDNAVKYSGEARAIQVELDARNGTVSVAVRDHGPGIPPSDLDRIFEKFYRVGSGLVHDAKGSGLGLAIVKHVAEAHGGSIQVESHLGAGSTFTLRLPAAHAG